MNRGFVATLNGGVAVAGVGWGMWEKPELSPGGGRPLLAHSGSEGLSDPEHWLQGWQHYFGNSVLPAFLSCCKLLLGWVFKTRQDLYIFYVLFYQYSLSACFV